MLSEGREAIRDVDILVKGEFREKPSTLQFHSFAINTPDPLIECRVTIRTCDYDFSTELSFETACIRSFLTSLQSLLETNQGTATLEAYDEGGKLCFSALQTPSSTIIIEGLIARPSIVTDAALYREMAEKIGRIPSGLHLKFGGIKTDQSYLQDTATQFRKIIPQFDSPQ